MNSPSKSIDQLSRRMAITVRGVVQGVGFRPFVYNAACDRGLSGWVRNEADMVRIEVQGDSAALTATVSLNPANGPKVEFSYVDELKRTLKEGFTAKEVAEAKKAYLDGRMVARSQDAALMSQLAQHELQGRTMMWDEALEAKIQALTPEQINAAFRKNIDPAALAIVKAGDFKAAGVYK